MVQCALVLIEISRSLFSCFLFSPPFNLSVFLSSSWGKWSNDLRWSITRLPVTRLHCTKIHNWSHQALSRCEDSLSIHPLISNAIHIWALRARSLSENSTLVFSWGDEKCADTANYDKRIVHLKITILSLLITSFKTCIVEYKIIIHWFFFFFFYSMETITAYRFWTK